MLTRRCAVLGSPIGHSLSPRLHLAAYAALGLDWRYDAYEVEAGELPGFVAALGPEWVRLSLTMPLKEAALALADDADPVASRVGAANTLLLGARRRALNTDVPGLQALLADHGVRSGAAPAPPPGADRHTAAVLGGGATASGDRHTAAVLGGGATASGDRHTAAVLGGGATARAVLVALAGWADDVVLAVRDPSRVGDLSGLFLPYPLSVVSLQDQAARSEALARAVVVSTTPAGSLDWLADGLAPHGSRLEHGYGAEPGLFVDVGYDPWPSRLAAAYQLGGRTVVGGLELLVRQAALQVEAMTGRPAPLEAMQAALVPRA